MYRRARPHGLAAGVGIQLACSGGGRYRALEMRYWRRATLPNGQASGDRSGHRGRRAEPNAGSGTPGVRPHRMTRNTGRAQCVYTADPCNTVHLRGIVGIDRLQRHISDLLGYLERNQDMLVHYAARRRRGEPISTAFVESAVNEIVAKRMNKRQQMRWNRTTLQPFLDVRTAVLNDTLAAAFRRRHPGFRPSNDDHVLSEAA